jgi:hypothetical protein
VKRTILATAIVAALAVPALIASASGQSAATPSTLMLVTLEREVHSGFVDNPPLKKESVGDMFTIDSRVRDADNKPAGTVHAYFVQTSKVTADGAATFALTGGNITIVGVMGRSGDDTLAVAGGTGTYAGAKGSARMLQKSGRTEFTVTLLG